MTQVATLPESLEEISGNSEAKDILKATRREDFKSTKDRVVRHQRERNQNIFIRED